jgi:hypothetical protein
MSVIGFSYVIEASSKFKLKWYGLYQIVEKALLRTYRL